jgi:hypothetical protein
MWSTKLMCSSNLKDDNYHIVTIGKRVLAKINVLHWLTLTTQNKSRQLVLF